MKRETELETAQAFLDEYADPEIEKRLYYEVWADRLGLNDIERQRVWQEVRRLTYRIAANKRKAMWRQKAARRAPIGPPLYAVD